MQNAAWNLPNSLIGNRAGTVVYEATCNCHFADAYGLSLGPHVGVAYQITPKTVFRAGGAIAYGSAVDQAQLSASVADFYGINPPAYGAAAPGVIPPASPFISIDPGTGRLPRIFQWSVGFQREIIRNLVVDASYVGNRGAWWAAPLLAAQNYNALTPQFLQSTYGINVQSPADATLLNTPINSPTVLARFPWLANPNNVYPGFPATQTLRQALRPYPQWGGVPPFLGPPMGDTWFDSLQVKVTKRYTHGLVLNSAFTWEKELTNG